MFLAAVVVGGEVVAMVANLRNQVCMVSHVIVYIISQSLLTAVAGDGCFITESATVVGFMLHCSYAFHRCMNI